MLYEGCRNPLLYSFALHNKRFKLTLTDGFTHGVLRKVKGQPDWYVLSVEGRLPDNAVRLSRHRPSK